MKYYLYFSIVLLFVSCSGGSSTSSSSSTSTSDDITMTFSGRVVDGYIKDAVVCLDLNINAVCDSSEPKVTSSADGSFTFQSADLSRNKVIPIISSGGIDIATNETYKGELFGSIDTSSTVITTIYINPFSDLILNTYLNSGSSIDEVKTKLANSFSLDTSELILNPMENKKLFAKIQELEHMKKILETSISNEKSSSLSSEEEKSMRRNIKISIINAMDGSNSLSWTKIIEGVESLESISFTSTKKDFLSNQFTSNRTTFDSLSTNGNIELDSLESLQNTINEELKEVHNKINTSDYTIVNLSSVQKLVSKSLLSINEAENKSYNTPPSIPDFR
jgi:hypothetical protein